MAGNMSGRQVYIELRDAKSSDRRSKQKVPQGGVISPPTDEVVTYADDTILVPTGNNVKELTGKSNRYLPALSLNLNRWLRILYPGRGSEK